MVNRSVEVFYHQSSYTMRVLQELQNISYYMVERVIVPEMMQGLAGTVVGWVPTPGIVAWFEASRYIAVMIYDSLVPPFFDGVAGQNINHKYIFGVFAGAFRGVVDSGNLGYNELGISFPGADFELYDFLSSDQEIQADKGWVVGMAGLPVQYGGAVEGVLRNFGGGKVTKNAVGTVQSPQWTREVSVMTRQMDVVMEEGDLSAEWEEW